MEFSELPIPEPVLAGIRECGFIQCTPIQAQTLPLALAGKDVAGQAQTGTGKTAAFLIATFARLLNSPDRRPAAHGDRSHPRALIIAPTRELAVQIERDAKLLGKHTGLTLHAVYGGVDYDQQLAALHTGKVDILVGTPGRLIDYFKQKAYLLNHAEVLVVDEADRMFDMGFIADLRFLMRRLPPFEQRLSMLFSATLSWRAQELSYEFMNNPEMVAPDRGVRTADRVTQVAYHVESNKKISLLMGLLRRDLVAANEEGMFAGRVLIFVNTKRMAEKLQVVLEANGVQAGYLSGDVHQTKRLKVLGLFQEGRLPVMIATDVAGRGLHIDGVTHVINFDLPEDPENYVHRIGRTARAGRDGDAISLVDEECAYRLEPIQEFLGVAIPVSWAEDDLFPKIHIPHHRSSAPARRPYESGSRDGRSGSGGGRGRSGGDVRSRPPRKEGGRRPGTVKSSSSENPPTEGG